MKKLTSFLAIFTMNKLLRLLTLLLIVCCAMIVFSACNERIDAPTGDGDVLEYYSSLEYGYQHGIFSDDEIATIANYHNIGMNFLDALTEKNVRSIQEMAAAKARIRDGHLDAKEEDFEILNYYGQIRGYLIFIIKDPYINVPVEAIDEWIEIGSAKIHYTSPYRISFMVDANISS